MARCILRRILILTGAMGLGACGSSSSPSGQAAAPEQNGATDGGSATGADGSGSAVVNGPVPTIGGCQIYPADNPWNTRVDDPQAYPVHPNSATYVANMSPGSHLHADWGDWSRQQVRHPVGDGAGHAGAWCR